MAIGRDIARFVDGKGNITAVLESGGRLSLKDGAGGLEVFNDYRDFIKQMMGIPPIKANIGEPEMLDQLSQALGKCEVIEDYVNLKSSKEKTMKKADAPAPAPAQEAPATESKVKKVPAKKAAEEKKAAKVVNSKAEKAVAEQNKRKERLRERDKRARAAVDPANFPECGCGCGQKCKSAAGRFLPGHDAKFHSMIKKYQKGQLKFTELTSTVQKHVRANGIKVATAA